MLFFGIMTQTPSSPEEYSTLIKVLLRPTLSIRYPTSAQLYAFHRANGIVRPIPDHTELQLIAARKVMRMESASRAIPASRACGPSPSVLADDESRLVVAKRPQLEAWCQQLGLSYVPHPSNPGLTAMRTRNALTVYLRRGGRLPPS